jgi:hypothetical protein
VSEDESVSDQETLNSVWCLLVCPQIRPLSVLNCHPKYSLNFWALSVTNFLRIMRYQLSVRALMWPCSSSCRACLFCQMCWESDRTERPVHHGASRESLPLPPTRTHPQSSVVCCSLHGFQSQGSNTGAPERPRGAKNEQTRRSVAPPPATPAASPRPPRTSACRPLDFLNCSPRELERTNHERVDLLYCTNACCGQRR